MFFDVESKFLCLGNEDLLKTRKTEYSVSDQYIQYQKYLKDGVKKDIKDYILPIIFKYIDNNIALIDEDDFDIDLKKLVDHRGSSYYRVDLILKRYVADENKRGYEKMSPITILKLPYMDQFGIIQHDGKLYSSISAIKVDNSITFDGEILKTVDGDHSFIIQGGFKTQIRMFKDSVELYPIISVMAQEYYGKYIGGNWAVNFAKSLRNIHVIKHLKGKDSYAKLFGLNAFDEVIAGKSYDTALPISDKFKLTEKIAGGYLSSIMSREALNELCSFKHAIGRTISRDILNADGEVVVEKNTLVTEEVISKLHRNYIDTIHVKNTAMVNNYVLGQVIILGNIIPAGCPVNKLVASVVPEMESYSVVYKTIELPEIFVIPNGTIIDNDVIELLEFFEIEEFTILTSTVTKAPIKVRMEEEYVNNRYFPVQDLIVSDEDEYDSIELIDEEMDGDLSLGSLIDEDDVSGNALGNPDYVFVDLNGDMVESSNSITCHDLAALYSMYIKLVSGKHSDILADADYGFRKRVHQIDEHMHKAFVRCAKKFERRNSFNKKVKKAGSISAFIADSDMLNTVFGKFDDEFFKILRNEMRVVDILDITNPMATASALSRVNVIVKDANAIPDGQRKVTMGHFGRICPYETPQSGKLGLTNNFATEAKVTDGVIRTPYNKVIHKDGKHYVSKEYTYFTIQEEENKRIGDRSRLQIDPDTGEILSKDKVLARVPMPRSLEKMTSAYLDIEYVDYVNVSSNQHCSHVCTSIPFAGSDDAARVSFELSMAKQAIGLVQGEVPIIATTGNLDIPYQTMAYQIAAEKDGIVKSISPNQVAILYDGDTKITTYNYNDFRISPNSVILMVRCVDNNQRLKRGDVIVTSNYMKDGIMACGVNALVAYMMDGYNYEDGQPCSKRIANKLTSYGVSTEKVPVNPKSYSVSIPNRNYKNYFIRHPKGSNIMNNPPIVQIREKMKDENRDIVKVTHHRPEHLQGYLLDASPYYSNLGSKKVEGVAIRTISFDILEVSDKICNRHGNKGVSCKIYENSDMPYLENGEFIDVLYNPTGVPSRMNLGQILEAPSGLACYVLGIRLMMKAFDSPSVEQVKRLVSYAFDLANRDDIESIFSEYSEYPIELHEHCRKNIDKIRNWRGTFDRQGMAYLINPKSGKRSLRKAVIGINYIYKEPQRVDIKIHVRGSQLTSDYVSKTGAPTHGAANGGGQASGYMELDAYMAYGAMNLLHEMMNERGDNMMARNNLTADALYGPGKMTVDAERYGMRRSVELMLQHFTSLGLKSRFTDGEFILNEGAERKAYKISQFKKMSVSETEPKEYESIIEDTDNPVLKEEVVTLDDKLFSETEKSLLEDLGFNF